MTDKGHIPSILDIQDKALLLPGRPQFWTSQHMAAFYQTSPKNVVRQFRRNPDRFPADFWFELRQEEIDVLVGHFGLPNKVNRGVLIGFTKAGALALSGVLKTPVSDAVSVQIVRAVIAIEEMAIQDARDMVARLHVEAQRKKPIYGLIQLSMANGLSLDQMWRMSSYPRWKLEQAAREMLAMKMIARLPEGMQPDLFGEG